MSALIHSLFASCPLFMEGLLFEELDRMGAGSVRETRAGASFRGTLELAYRVCLWSRVASRVFLHLRSFPAATRDELYRGARGIPWHEHLSSRDTLAVSCSLSGSSINHSGFAALVVKDAVVDSLREQTGDRPDVDTERPDLRVNLLLHRDRATVSIDLAGESLHRRSYRARGGEASLKENVAAAVLLRAGWPRIAAKGGAFLDPMCGAGTLPIEAALMAADIAPGLLRETHGFLRWRGHDHRTWDRLIDEARERRERGLRGIPPVAGYDLDRAVLEVAEANATAAGLGGVIRFRRVDIAHARPPAGDAVRPGLIAVNPPYGERMEAEEGLASLYGTLGAAVKERFAGWRLSLLTGHTELSKSTGLRAEKVHTLYNGSIRCCLAHFAIR